MRVLLPILLLLAVSCGDDSALVEICDNGIDDDLNELIDCEDYESCAMDPACMAEENCSDGVDNDMNSLTDCEDPHCADADPCIDGGGG